MEEQERERGSSQGIQEESTKDLLHCGSWGVGGGQASSVLSENNWNFISWEKKSTALVLSFNKTNTLQKKKKINGYIYFIHSQS